MMSGQLLQAVVESWDELPFLLGLDTWPGLYERIAPVVPAARSASTDNEKAQRVYELIKPLRHHPAAQRRLRTAFQQIQRDRTTEPFTAALGWQAQLDLLDRRLHPRMVTRYTQILVPSRVARGSWQSITVRLTRGPESLDSLALVAAEEREVEVSCHACVDGVEIAAPDRATLWITRERDSAPIAFLFRCLEVGPKKMLLGFRQDGKSLGQVPLLVEVDRETLPDVQERKIHGPVLSDRDIPQPVDLDLDVTLEPRNGKTFLKYRLSSPSQVADLSSEAIESREITGSPEDFRAGLLSKIEKLQHGLDIDGSPLTFSEIQKKIDAIGRNLYEDLFPPPLRRLYREVRDRIRTIQITSQEPFIPWELIKPYDDEDESPERLIDDDFLGCRYQVTRWLAGRAPAAAVRVSRIVCVEAGKVPGAPPLPHAAAERDRIAALARAHSLEDASPSPATFEAIESLLTEGRMGIFHAVAHGDFSARSPDESSLLLEDGRSLRPGDLQGPIKTGIRNCQPLVFLNACRVGQQSWALAGLGGWARRWVERCGCGAFVAPLWSVDDRLACQFAQVFYDTLERGESFGAAAQAARRSIRETAPWEPTWLAYSVYGHPNGRLVLVPPQRQVKKAGIRGGGAGS